MKLTKVQQSIVEIMNSHSSDEWIPISYQDSDEWIPISYQDIAMQIEVCHRTVKNHIVRLKEEGLIEKRERVGKSNLWKLSPELRPKTTQIQSAKNGVESKNGTTFFQSIGLKIDLGISKLKFMVCLIIGIFYSVKNFTGYNDYPVKNPVKSASETLLYKLNTYIHGKTSLPSCDNSFSHGIKKEKKEKKPPSPPSHKEKCNMKSTNNSHMDDKEYLLKVLDNNYPRIDFTEDSKSLDMSFDEAASKWADYFISKHGVNRTINQGPGAEESFRKWLNIESKKTHTKMKEEDSEDLQKKIDWVLDWIENGWKCEITKVVRSTVRKRILELQKKGREEDMKWIVWWVMVEGRKDVDTVEILGKGFDRNVNEARRWATYRKKNRSNGEIEMIAESCRNRALRNGANHKEGIEINHIVYRTGKQVFYDKIARVSN